MTVPITHALFNLDGSPKTDATPVFLLGPDGARDYRSSVGARTPPPITRISDNLYGFTPTEADERIGVAYVIDAGADCLQRYFVGVVAPSPKPFEVAFFTDAQGDVWTGGAPSVGVYADVQGNVRTPPALKAISGAYLYLLVPTAADLNAGVAFRVDAPAGAVPEFWSGTLAASLAQVAITKARVLERFPELAAEPELTEVVWNELLLDVAMEVPAAAWMDQDAADRAALWLAAHVVALEKRRLLDGLAGVTQPGELQSITVGPVTKTWASMSVGGDSKGKEERDEVLSRTAYGREYLRLRKLFCRVRRR